MEKVQNFTEGKIVTPLLKFATPTSTILQITMCGVFLYICVKREKN